MNKNAIRSTAVCLWDATDKCFIVQSPLYDALIGAAESEAEAWEIFDDFLDDAYTSYLEGRLGGMYAKRGRPAKNRTGIHCEVKPETKRDILGLTTDLGCSQGEIIDYLAAFFKAAKSNESTAALVSRPLKRTASTARKVAPGSKSRSKRR